MSDSPEEHGPGLAVVTGASRGIEAGIAAATTADGAVVAVCNRSASDFEWQLTVDLSHPEPFRTALRAATPTVLVQLSSGAGKNPYPGWTSMQAEIRNSDSDAFPNVDRFQGLHDNGRPADPTEVGATIWQIARSDTWANGTVGDLSLART